MPRDFDIDPEIAALLPPLAEEERRGLALQIETDGHVDDLVVLDVSGDRVLGDGHNRLAICEEFGLPYETRTLKLVTREAAIQWVIDNQLARRNLTDERRAYYRGKDYLAAKQRHGGQKAKGSAQNAHSVKTSSKVAKKHGVHPATVRRDAEFAAAVDRVGAENPAAKEAILSGAAGVKKADVIAAGGAEQLFCRPCRVGTPKAGCRDCAARRDAGTVERPAAPAPATSPEPVRDRAGLVIPEKLAPTFAEAVALFKLAESQAKALAQTVNQLAAVPGGAWLRAELSCRTDGGDGQKFVCEDLAAHRGKLKGAAPYCSACPYCEAAHAGKVDRNCRACRGLGWGPKSLWDRAPEAERKLTAASRGGSA